MRFRMGGLIAALACACSSFDADSAQPSAGDGGDASSSSSSSSSSGNPPPPTPPPSGSCPKFADDFETFKTGAGSWKIVTNPTATVTTASGITGRSLLAHWDTQASGTVNAYATRGFNRTSGCPLHIELDVRARPLASGTLNLLVIQGSSSNTVKIRHTGSFWYLDAGSTQQQLTTFPGYDTTGRIALDVTDSGAHVVVEFTYGSYSQTVDDPAAVLGTGGIDLQLGAQLVGTTTGATEAEFDNLDVSY